MFLGESDMGRQPHHFHTDLFTSFRTDRDDMGGVGNFNRDCRTLYIGGLRRLPGLKLEVLL